MPTTAALGLLTFLAAAPAPPPPPPADTTVDAAPPSRLALGYKIGNGLGFAGAELVAGLHRHLALGLQANYFSETVDDGAGGDGSRARGFGLAPFVQLRLSDGRSTPYLSAGGLYARLDHEAVTATMTGGFANVGWQWTWDSGLAIVVGGGVQAHGDAEATDGVRTVRKEGGVHVNLEAALRYYFF